MAAVISEDHIEQIVIQEFIDLGYSYVNGADISLNELRKAHTETFEKLFG